MTGPLLFTRCSVVGCRLQLENIILWIKYKTIYGFSYKYLYVPDKYNFKLWYECTK